MIDIERAEFISMLHPDSLQVVVQLASSAPPGGFAEVGVYKGGCAALLYSIADDQGRTVDLFDTFCGMPFQGEHDEHKIGDFADADLPKIRAWMPNARIHVGIFPETMPDDMPPLAFVHVDCDQYQSVRDCIDYLYPLLVPGGVMLFDDFGVLRSAEMAVNERFPGKINLTPQGKGYVRKPL